MLQNEKIAQSYIKIDFFGSLSSCLLPNIIFHPIHSRASTPK